MSIEIDFRGWFQCRLATDPDRFDEPRGTSQGWTFALGDEPNLDRIIRFHNPVAHRSHAPPIGVWVDQVRQNGQIAATHPLLRAKVDLIDGPVFEGRNGRLAPTDTEPIVPWHLRIEGADGIVIDGFDPMDFSDPNELPRRQPLGPPSRTAEVLTITGIGDADNYRAQRSAAVQAELDRESVQVRQQALQFRLAQLAMKGNRRDALLVQVDFAFDLRGPNQLVDPSQRLGTTGTTGWRVAFWMGGWDADGLCGFVKGTLSLP
jgi:hypothetical protein